MIPAKLLWRESLWRRTRYQSPAGEEAGEEEVHEGGLDTEVQPVEGGHDVPA